MQKIVIKNFGAVKNAEIEVKKTLLLIGEQASGKSTIAKLIYFFKSIRDDLFDAITNNYHYLEKVPEKFQTPITEADKEKALLYPDEEMEFLIPHFDLPFFNKVYKNFEITKDFIFPLKKKFETFFGISTNFKEFNVKYFYNVEKDNYISISFDTHKNLTVQTSISFQKTIVENAQKLKKSYEKKVAEVIYQKSTFGSSPSPFEHWEISNIDIKEIATFVNKIFNSYHSSSLYVVAGRNATVTYSEMFDKYLYANEQKRIEQAKSDANFIEEQTIDEILMLDFIKRINKIKNVFKKYENFEKIISSNSTDEEHKKILQNLLSKINKILKGKYTLDYWGGERLVVKNDDGKQVPIRLNNSSSGQQEAIRILQDIFLLLAEKQKSLRIIEEPEAHLFPVAQKLIVEILAYYTNLGNELIITTHSPYILTVFNNLLFSQRVADKCENAKPEIEKLIDSEIWIKQDGFSAYSLASNEDRIYCENIINPKTGLIQQNYLDTVSEVLSNDFQKLYSIYAKHLRK